MAIQRGSIVWLKTGSEAMTVKGETVAGECICNWQVNGVPYTDYYMEEQLTEVKPDGKGLIDDMI